MCMSAFTRTQTHAQGHPPHAPTFPVTTYPHTPPLQVDVLKRHAQELLDSVLKNEDVTVERIQVGAG